MKLQTEGHSSRTLTLKHYVLAALVAVCMAVVICFCIDWVWHVLFGGSEPTFTRALSSGIQAIGAGLFALWFIRRFPMGKTDA